MGYERTARREELELVRRMLAGDVAAKNEFADGYFPGLYRFARSRLRGDAELARDIVQTTACKVLGKLSSYRGDAPLFTFLCACCRNEIAMHFRHRTRFPELALEDEGSPIEVAVGSSAESPERNAEMRESAAQVHVALDRLPPRYQSVLEWKYLDGLPVVEIAARLGVGQKAAESLLTRARAAFREAFDGVSSLGAARAATRENPMQQEAADHG
jgi:RNA polymerase sigma-70 factor, ECF subfamily